MTTLHKTVGSTPPSEPVGSEPAGMHSPAGSPTAMCSAIPVAVRSHNWQEPRTCASHASTSVFYAGEYRDVCRMHEQAWRRAVRLGRAIPLATDWGWA